MKALQRTLILADSLLAILLCSCSYFTAGSPAYTAPAKDTTVMTEPAPNNPNSNATYATSADPYQSSGAKYIGAPVAQSTTETTTLTASNPTTPSTIETRQLRQTTTTKTTTKTTTTTTATAAPGDDSSMVSASSTTTSSKHRQRMSKD